MLVCYDSLELLTYLNMKSREQTVGKKMQKHEPVQEQMSSLSDNCGAHLISCCQTTPQIVNGLINEEI